MTSDSGDFLDECVNSGSVAFYGYQYSKLPDQIYSKEKGTSKLFIKQGTENPVSKLGHTQVARYQSLIEMRDHHADVIFLDRDAVKVLLAKFPVTSKYLLIRFTPRLSWFLALPGLLRRVMVGLVEIQGIKKIKISDKNTNWLVVKHLLSKSLQTRFSISEKVGIQGFLDYLRSEQIHYVVLRFFEKLPELNRDGGDIDILVSDEDEGRIREFLHSNPGTIGVDIWTPSRSTHNSITYYPPPLARQVIQSAIDGPAHSKIPAPMESFLSFAYHCLYHKGYLSGLPSNIINYHSTKKPENDYAGVLGRLAKEAGVDVDINMESIDDYLAKAGWQPKMDTLAKIAPWNTWVKKRFFSGNKDSEIGLGVFILKRKVLDLGLLDEFVSVIKSYDGFEVLRVKEFNAEEMDRVTRQLRGGVWDDVSGSVTDFMPAVAIVVLDKHTLKKSKAGAPQKSLSNRTRDFKKILRKKFDKERVSLTHSTDFTYEAWEYIEDCFPEEKEQIRAEVEEMYNNVSVSRLHKLKTVITSSPNHIKQFLFRMKKDIAGRLVQYLID